MTNGGESLTDAPPIADRREQHQPLFHAAADDGRGRGGVGLDAARLDDVQRGHQAEAVDGADVAGEPPADADRLGHEDLAHLAGVLDQALLLDHAQVGQHGRRTDRIAGVGRGHGPGRIEVHHVRPADDGRDRQPARNALAATDQVGRDAVVLEAPVLAGAAEAGLHLVEDQQGAVLVAPAAEFLGVLGRHEAGIAALVRLAHHAGHAVGRDALLGQRLEESLEAGIGTAEAVGKRHLHHVLVEVDDPLLQGRDAAGHLGAQRAAVEGVLEASRS